jgi:hypothetical protein
MPVIPATWEIEIGGWQFEASLGKKLVRSISKTNQKTKRKTIRTKILKIKLKKSQMLVAHAYNPSYSGGRDQEDHDSKPALANSL